VPENPNVQISTTLNGAVAEAVYAKALSYGAGIRTGNITTQGWLGVGCPPFDVIGQEDGSVVFCPVIGIGASLTETSGAPVFDTIHGLGAWGWAGTFRRTGVGVHTFDFDVPAATDRLAAAALEILPIG
jgi:hypothetical protein